MNRFLFPLLDRPRTAGGGGGSFPPIGGGAPPRYPDGRLRFVIPTADHRPYHARCATAGDAYLLYVHHNHHIRRSRPQRVEWPPQPRPKPAGISVIQRLRAALLRKKWATAF